MENRSLWALLPLLLLVCPVLASSSAELRLKPKEHAALGGKMADYFKALRETKDVSEKQEAVQAELEKIRKKIDKKGELGFDALSLTEDLGQALWYSYDYRGARGVRKGKVADFAYPLPYYGEDYQVEYVLWAPAKYKVQSGPYPLIITLADEGIRPADHVTERWTDPDTRQAAIIACCSMPEDTTMWASRGGPGKPGGIGNLLIMLKEVSTRYAIDFDRVYLAGRGVGASAAMEIASRSPDRFAGVLGRSGDIGDVRHENFRNLPTYFAGGGEGVSRFEETVEKAGFANCTVKSDATEKDFWEWMQQTKRISNPSEVILVPDAPAPVRAYWIEVPSAAYEGQASIKGTIDRDSNTVTLVGEGIATATLYLNDILVDLDQPLKVICNGVEHIDQVPRNFTLTFNAMFNSISDPGKIYTASNTYDLSAAQD